MKNIVAFTPIKMNSSRLPWKNILELGGKPMLNHQIETVSKLGISNYVYCSDEKILPFIENIDDVHFIERDVALDADNILGYDIYKSFIDKIDADIYILYHTTSPLLAVKYFQEGLNSILSGKHDSSFTVEPVNKFVWYNGSPINYDTKKIAKTQDLSPVYIETSGFYMFTKETFLQHKSRIGATPYMVEVDCLGAIDIDYYDEFRMAELCMKTQ